MKEKMENNPRNDVAQNQGASQVPAADAVPRLAYSMDDAANMLGISYASVSRLIARGQLKACSTLRTKLITRAEIERFLNTPTL